MYLLYGYSVLTLKVSYTWIAISTIIICNAVHECVCESVSVNASCCFQNSNFKVFCLVIDKLYIASQM